MDTTTLQDGLFDIARSIREEGQEVAPIAFLISPDGVLVQVLLFTMPKDKWRPTILDGIKKTRALAVIVHTEAWVVGGADAPAALAAKLAGLPSLEVFPGRSEVLQSMLECKDGTTRTLTAGISDGGLGKTQVSDRRAVGGEMVGFFGTSSSGLSPSA